MQQQNNYSKLRYSNSVYNKADRRGYQKAFKVLTSRTVNFFSAKIREFHFKIYYKLFFETIKENFSLMNCEMLPVLPVLVLSGHDSTVQGRPPDLDKHFINENEWETWTWRQSMIKRRRRLSIGTEIKQVKWVEIKLLEV